MLKMRRKQVCASRRLCHHHHERTPTTCGTTLLRIDTHQIMPAVSRKVALPFAVPVPPTTNPFVNLSPPLTLLMVRVAGINPSEWLNGKLHQSQCRQGWLPSTLDSAFSAMRRVR